MINTAIFIRNDTRLLSSLDLLKQTTNLCYIVLKDNNINSLLRKEFLNSKTEILTHESFLEGIKKNQIKALNYIFSLYYQKKIEKSILIYPNKGCINFHPAPLPVYRGVGNYSRCILEGRSTWGVSAHFMDEEFDNGDIIDVNEFDIDEHTETYYSLEIKSLKQMKKLFSKVVYNVVQNRVTSLNIEIEKDKIKYLTRVDVQKMKLIGKNDNAELISKKIRAFWRPPFDGASITIGNKKFTIVDDFILNELGKFYK